MRSGAVELNMIMYYVLFLVGTRGLKKKKIRSQKKNNAPQKYITGRPRRKRVPPKNERAP